MKMLLRLFLASLAVLATSACDDKKTPDCSTIIYDMMDCVSFLSDGSKDQKPSSSCCIGLESVLSADPKCLCVAIKSSSDMGIKLNLTKAAALPKTCGLSAPPLSKCDISNPPSASPDKAPSHSPAEPPSESPDIAPSPPSESPDTPPSEPPSEFPDTPPSVAPPTQPSSKAPSSDTADTHSPKSGVSHSAPAISILLISLLLLLTFDVSISFIA